MADLKKSRPLRVMLVDDHDVVRNGLRALVSANDDMKVVAEAGTVGEAIATAEKARPDVVVMDVRLTDGSGVEATRAIRSSRPKTKVLMLTSFADDDALVASIVAGASGYVLKQVAGNDLIESIRAVGAGKTLMDEEASAAVIDRVRRGKHFLSDPRLARLSPQEERVLEQIADGRTNGEIAAALGLAEKTVKNYVSSVLMKLDVGRRAEAAAYMARHVTTDV